MVMTIPGVSSVLSPQPATNIRDIPNKPLITVYFNAYHRSVITDLLITFSKGLLIRERHGRQGFHMADAVLEIWVDI